ncbi:hypothetical protein SCHPADRAFT_902158 [Schizopora paradoxa]|uniref:DUF2423 domain-containing protein n=1 Tax=Schizopora paradoxa TaxID=27342 RepID=A0A0H2S1J8_9AGAM|nr:hypothetical protein SCHPADRAFT_902158 [Schizopora paradoxa]
MAKSLRSKVKRHYRGKKREEGVYAAHDAARLQRLSSKLTKIRGTDKKELIEVVDGDEEKEEMEEDVSLDKSESEVMQVEGESTAEPKKVSTHGRTPSRREEWRIAKGKAAKPKSKGMNRQGGLAGKRKPGRSHRRR